MPKISIIIPVYNHAKEIKSCLDSIFKQTYQDFEIIVVNDGSTDNLKDVLGEYKDKIKIINQENQGAPAARNRGFEESQGKYVIFCDADWVLKQDMLEKMVKALDEHPEVSYVYCSYKFGWKKFKLWPFDPERIKKMPCIPTSCLIRKEHFPGFDETLKKFQDWDLALTMLEQGHTGYLIPEFLFKIKPRKKGGMSMWFPKIFFKFPFKSKRIRNEIEKYNIAKKIIKDKHGI